MLRSFLAASLAFVATGVALADLRITEWMYNGADGEFIEFTNVGGAAIDMTGWSFDDLGGAPGGQPLDAFGIVQPGESVVLTEITAALFRTNWSLPLTVDVIGGNANNLGRSDQINLYNGLTLVDRLTYNDQDGAGPRANEFSGNPINAAALGANNDALWVLSADPDAYGSYTGANFSVGNPGTYVPEPGTLALLALGGVAMFRRRAV